MTEEIKKEEIENLSIVDKTEQMLKSITEQNRIFQENLAKQEDLYAKMVLGGRSQTNPSNPTPEPDKSDILANEMIKAFR